MITVTGLCTVFRMEEKKKTEMKILFQNFGTVTVKLMPEIAPLACAHMEKAAAMGKYENRVIERLEPGFVIQPLFFDGRDPVIDEMTEPEFRTVEANHSYVFQRGTVAMAGTEDAASGSQFFLTLASCARLNGNFTVVGEVEDGWNVIEAIEKLPVKKCTDPESGFGYHCPEKDTVVENVIFQN